MLQPKRTKFRKQHRGVVRGARIKGSKINFGDFGLKTLEAGWITARQIEAARKAILAVFDILGLETQIVREYQRKLGALLF